MNAEIKMRQYVTFTKPQNFDTADIQCFTVVIFVSLDLLAGQDRPKDLALDDNLKF